MIDQSVLDQIKAVAEIIAIVAGIGAAGKFLFGSGRKVGSTETQFTNSIELVKASVLLEVTKICGMITTIQTTIDSIKAKIDNTEADIKKTNDAWNHGVERMAKLEGKVETLEKMIQDHRRVSDSTDS